MPSTLIDSQNPITITQGNTVKVYNKVRLEGARVLERGDAVGISVNVAYSRILENGEREDCPIGGFLYTIDDLYTDQDTAELTPQFLQKIFMSMARAGKQF